MYIWNLIYAIWTWISIWKMKYSKAERRYRFFRDAFEGSPTEKTLPYKLIIKAYKKRLHQFSTKEVKNKNNQS